MKYILYTILIFSATMSGFAADQLSLIKKIGEGNKFYLNSEYDAAQQQYADAQIDAPDNPDISYNLGNVFYKQKKYDKATAAYQKALTASTSELEAKCRYNIGDCLVQQGKLREALESYKLALKLNRDDEDTKYNIEYVQRKLKELADKKKKKEKQDPLNKLLKRLERLIGLQAHNLVQTKKTIESMTVEVTNKQDFSSAVLNVETNEQYYSVETYQIREGFRDLRTNLPPERLHGTPKTQQAGQSPKITLDAPTRELVNIFQSLINASNCLQPTNATNKSIITTLTQIENSLGQAANSSSDELNKQFAANGKEIVGGIRNTFETPGQVNQTDVEKLSEGFGELMQNIQSTLKNRAQSQTPAMFGGTNGTTKTLAQKIDNAVVFLATAKKHIDKAVSLVRIDFTNSPPDQATGLEYLIKARKEFEDKNKNKKDKKKNNQNKQQDKKDKQQSQKDKDDKEKNKDQQKDKPEQQKQQKQQDNQKQKDKQKQQEQPKPKLDKQQVKQMLKNYKQDQRNKRKMRKEKVKASGYVPVDKDW